MLPSLLCLLFAWDYPSFKSKLELAHCSHRSMLPILSLFLNLTLFHGLSLPTISFQQYFYQCIHAEFLLHYKHYKQRSVSISIGWSKIMEFNKKMFFLFFLKRQKKRDQGSWSFLDSIWFFYYYSRMIRWWFRVKMGLLKFLGFSKVFF